MQVRTSTVSTSWISAKTPLEIPVLLKPVRVPFFFVNRLSAGRQSPPPPEITARGDGPPNGVDTLSERTNAAPAIEEMSDDQLDSVSGGIIIHGRFAQLPAVQADASSILLGGPDTKPAGTQA